MKATAPIGSGCRIKPSTVAIKTASKCHASTVTPSGTGRNHRMSPTPIVMSAFLLFVFMFSPHQKYEFSVAVPFCRKHFLRRSWKRGLAAHTSETYGNRAALRPEHSQKKQPPPANERRDCKISLPCLALAHAASQRIKSPPKRRRKDADRPAQDADPLPVARRSDGDRQSGSSPGFSSSLLCTFPSSPSDVFCRFARCHSGGTAPAPPASLLSLATPDSSVCCLS